MGCGASHPPNSRTSVPPDDQSDIIVGGPKGRSSHSSHSSSLANAIGELDRGRKPSYAITTKEPSPMVAAVATSFRILKARVAHGINDDVEQFQEEIALSTPTLRSKDLARIREWTRKVAVSRPPSPLDDHLELLPPGWKEQHEREKAQRPPPPPEEPVVSPPSGETCSTGIVEIFHVDDLPTPKHTVQNSSAVSRMGYRRPFPPPDRLRRAVPLSCRERRREPGSCPAGPAASLGSALWAGS